MAQWCKQILLPSKFAATVLARIASTNGEISQIYFLKAAQEFQFGVRESMNGNSASQFPLCSNEQTAIRNAPIIVAIHEMDFRPLPGVASG